MKGCRPLDRDERRAALKHCQDQRERALLALGFATGYRISELLSLRIGDVVDAKSQPLKWVSVRAGKTKTKEGRTVALNADAGHAAATLAKTLLAAGCERSAALFQGKKSGLLKPISRIHAWRLLTALFARADVSGNVATHSLRKTFAAECYRLLGGALEKVQIALGHKSITSTVCYLSFRHSDIDDAVLAIEL
jgi:site-specific recombinase XerD